MFYIILLRAETMESDQWEGKIPIADFALAIMMMVSTWRLDVLDDILIMLIVPVRIAAICTQSH